MPEVLKTLIVDDEYHARKLLTEYVGKLSFLEPAGTASNIFEATNILQQEKIDILLLDIQMPEITGLEFARSLRNPPAIIFTTAYSEYAVESYELDVVDYLLKPIDFPRFLQAITKVMERKGKAPAVQAIEVPPAPKERPAEKAKEDSMVIKSGYKFFKVNYSELIYIEGQREYVSFHTTKQNIMALYSLRELEKKLPSDQFVRIHKSYIVSISHIESIEKNTLQIAGKKLPIGNSFKENLMNLFDGNMQ